MRYAMIMTIYVDDVWKNNAILMKHERAWKAYIRVSFTLHTTSVTSEAYIPRHDGECMLVALWITHYAGQRVFFAGHIHAEIA